MSILKTQPVPLLRNLSCKQVFSSRLLSIAFPKIVFAPRFGSFGDLLSISLLVKEFATALNKYRESLRKFQESTNGLEFLGERALQAEVSLDDSKLVVSDDVSAAAMQIGWRAVTKPEPVAKIPEFHLNDYPGLPKSSL